MTEPAYSPEVVTALVAILSRTRNLQFVELEWPRDRAGGGTTESYADLADALALCGHIKFARLGCVKTASDGSTEVPLPIRMEAWPRLRTLMVTSFALGATPVGKGVRMLRLSAVSIGGAELRSLLAPLEALRGLALDSLSRVSLESVADALVPRGPNLIGFAITKMPGPEPVERQAFEMQLHRMSSLVALILETHLVRPCYWLAVSYEALRAVILHVDERTEDGRAATSVGIGVALAQRRCPELKHIRMTYATDDTTSPQLYRIINVCRSIARNALMAQQIRRESGVSPLGSKKPAAHSLLDLLDLCALR